MPCQAGPPADFISRSLINEVNELTRLLCMACKEIDNSSEDMSHIPEVRDWYIKHLEVDRQRIAKEAREKEKKKQRQIKSAKDALKRKRAELKSIEKSLRELEND